MFVKLLKLLFPSNIKDRLFITKDGFRELIFSHLIAHSIFRFWIYPSYWRYLFTKFLKKFCLWQPKIRMETSHSRYLTGVPNPYAGIGHQLCNWNAALIFASKYNLNFVHHPLISKLKESKWEEFLGFGEGELLYEDVINKKSIKIVKLPRVRWNTNDTKGHFIVSEIINYAYPGSNILFYIANDQSVYDYTIVKDILRTKYWNNKKKNFLKCDFRQDKLNIAVHIRRGDILQMNKKDKNFQQRWLDNTYFINIINTIKSQIYDNIVIHIFSQGKIADFSDFEKIGNVVYHLDEDEYKTFHNMILADILIVSPSSFSYFAGIISPGLKIAKYPWLHELPEDSEWIRSDENGNFNPAALMKRFGKISKLD